ncbi:MAG TPA: M1 family aminopeptidase [Thermoanaerobaculia bacterium]|nr:M1 family aminopeptidase [Thermoanaerobaculia bacterium]
MRLARILAVAAAFFATSLFADTDPAYTALRASKPDGRTIAVNNLTFDRDVIHMTFNGTLHLLAPVDGKTPGAVFVGTGTYELTPATKLDLRSVQLNAGDDKLASVADTFETAVIFGPEVIAAAQSLSGEPKTGTPDGRAAGVFDEYMKKQRRDWQYNRDIRLLQTMLNGEKDPYFYAWLKSSNNKYGQAILNIDPRGLGQSGEQTELDILDQKKGGTWYESYYKSDVDKGMAFYAKPLVDADNYAIDTKIIGNRGEISGTSTATFTVVTDGIRVIPVYLGGKLRVTEVAVSPAGGTPNWTPVPWIQEKEKEDDDTAIVFPQPLKAGDKYTVKFVYGGKEVLDDAGDGNYTVNARMSWYPNFGTFDDTAMYDLTFRTPQKFQVVGVGEEISNKVEGDTRIAEWKSTTPLRVAGFNYGRFKKLSTTDKDSGMTIDVYTNPGTPDIVHQINQALAAGEHAGEFGMPTGPTSVNISTERLAQSAQADGINTARTGNAYFGSLTASKHVAITQQSQWNFGQSWPSLIYLPYIAFLDSTTRNTLGLNGAKDFVDLVGPHEFGHQWWGHQVGWRSYHDVWLSEGFAEFTAALVWQQTAGWNGYNQLFEKKRKRILERPTGATITNDQAGPIYLGYRLSTWQDPEAYAIIVYEKGAYVLHMLRMAMQDRSRKNPDEPFIAAMTDFAQTYTGKNPSTRDFQKVVEKHMPKNMDLQGNGSLDWFFKQWVYGTAIPKLEGTGDATDIGGGKYHIKVMLTQSQVPDDFASIVPIYVTFDKGQIVRLATVPILGNSSKPVEFDVPLPMKPKTVSINVMHDVLAR